jgi:LytR cell envelope-related transcriptional attenuator
VRGLGGGPRRRGEQGVAFPSPVVMLSVVAIAMAAIAFVATRHQAPTEQVVTPAAQASPSAVASPTPLEAKKQRVRRNKVFVEVYNNSGVSGLAGRVAARATEAGWQVVGEDNWYGTIPASTVYYPPRLKVPARQLALDLGIRRLQPAVDPMRMDRLTVILTDDPR